MPVQPQLFVLDDERQRAERLVSVTEHEIAQACRHADTGQDAGRGTRTQAAIEVPGRQIGCVSLVGEAGSFM